ncbi:Golgi apparatus membrane protein TVP23 A, partial [Ascosphaera atra]
MYLILVFIINILLLSADFYYLKNIAGRRLVGLRWWNEVDTSTGHSHWVFESSDPNTRTINGTDRRFFWLSLYATPALWIALAILAVLRLQSPIWLSLVGKLLDSQEARSFGCARWSIALALTLTNTVAFSRCDKFSQASNLASSAVGTGIFNNLAG